MSVHAFTYNLGMTQAALCFRPMAGSSGEFRWGPGDTLPRDCETTTDDFLDEFRSCMQKMESKIDTLYSDFSTKLQNIESRVTSLEQTSHLSIPSSSTSSSDNSSADCKRKRRTPPELQVCTFGIDPNDAVKPLHVGYPEIRT